MLQIDFICTLHANSHIVPTLCTHVGRFTAHGYSTIISYRQGKVAGEQSVSAARASLTSALASQETVQLPDGAEVTAAQAAIESAEVAVEVAQRGVAVFRSGQRANPAP